LSPRLENVANSDPTTVRTISARIGDIGLRLKSHFLKSYRGAVERGRPRADLHVTRCVRRNEVARQQRRKIG
jgi:hypothetical protein